MRWSVVPAIAVLLVACASHQQDIYKERNIVEQQVCARASLRETSAALDALGFEYHVDESHKQLLGFKSYNEGQADRVTSFIAVDVRFSDLASKPSACEVKVRFSGL